MSKLVLSLILMIILIIPISFSAEDYNETGTSNQQYRVGTGIFNSALTTSSSALRSLTDGQNIPLVSDLDGDGDNEIIVIDSATIRLFKSETLDIVDSFTMESGTYSNPILQDLDEDGFTEIILANEVNGNVSIVQYNGTVIKKVSQRDFRLPTIATGQTEIMIQCGDDQNLGESQSCLIVTATSSNGAEKRNLSIGSFNFSDSSPLTTLLSNPNTALDYCLPLIPSISYSDFDTGDTRKEFIFSFTEFDQSGNENLRVFAIDVAEDLTRTTDLNIAFSSNYNPSTSPATCADLGKFYTSPLVDDIDGSTSNGKEIIVGINEDSQDFVMKVFKSTGSVLDTHPNLFQADGEIVSNVMKANIFGDTGEVEYCVLGHDDDDQKLDLLCGSQLTGNIFNTLEFKYSTDSRFNVTTNYNEQNIISHMGQHSSATVDISGEGLLNPTELINTYGVFQIKDTTFNGSTFIKTIDLIYENPAGDSACIQVDEQKVGSEDLICLKDTSLTYIDDSISNQPAEITSIETNPCIDSVIKANTSLEVQVVVTDQNPSPLALDLVSSTVTVYDGDDNMMNSTISGVSSGTTMPHTFVLNKTGSNIALKVQGFDDVEGSAKDVITQSFTVGSSGVEFGDCSSNLITAVTEEETVLTATLTEDATDNAITGAITTTASLSGLAGTTFWFILMLAFSMGIYFRGASLRWTGNAILGAIAFVNLLFIIIGARVGIISTSLVIIISIISIAIVGVFLGKFFTGTSDAI